MDLKTALKLLEKDAEKRAAYARRVYTGDNYNHRIMRVYCGVLPGVKKEGRNNDK